MWYTENCVILCGERQIVRYRTDRTQMLPLILSQFPWPCFILKLYQVFPPTLFDLLMELKGDP